MRYRRHSNSPAGLIFVVIFSICWTAIAAQSGFFPMIVIGLAFVGFSIYNLVKYFVDKKGRGDEGGSTSYTTYDRSFGENGGTYSASSNNYCPYCGAPTERDHDYCTNCGKKLRDGKSQ